jgi:hypothetical protein
MRITRTRLIEQTEAIDYICNKCGEQLARDQFGDETGAYLGLPNYTYVGSYHSGTYEKYTSKIQDGVAYTFSLCEDCLSRLFDSFIIPPSTSIGEYFGNNGSRKYLDFETQQKINQIFQLSNISELVVYLTDEQEVVREYAKVKISQLGTASPSCN